MTCAIHQNQAHLQAPANNTHSLLVRRRGVGGAPEVGRTWFPSPPGPEIGLRTLNLAPIPHPLHPQPAGPVPFSIPPPSPHPHPAASGLRQKGKKLGLSAELLASKRTRRPFKPKCRKNQGSLRQPPRGAARTTAVPAGPTAGRALAPAPTAAPPSPPGLVLGLTSSGVSVNLLAL